MGNDAIEHPHEVSFKILVQSRFEIGVNHYLVSYIVDSQTLIPIQVRIIIIFTRMIRSRALKIISFRPYL